MPPVATKGLRDQWAVVIQCVYDGSNPVVRTLQDSRGEGAGELRQKVDEPVTSRDLSAYEHRNRDGRVEVSARDVTKREDHCTHRGSNARR